MGKTITLLASHSSHLPFLTTLKSSGVTQRHGFDLDLYVTGGSKAKTMEERSGLLLRGEVDFISGLHHEPYVFRAKGNKRFVYLAQTQNNWDDRLLASSKIKEVTQLRGKKILIHSKAPCVSGNLFSVLESCGVSRDSLEVEFTGDKYSGNFKKEVDRVVAGEADAVLVDLPYDLYGKKKGLNIISLPDRPVIHNTTILTTTDTIREHEEAVYAFLKALIEAIHFFKTRKQETLQLLKRELADRLQLEAEDEWEHLYSEWSRLLSRKPYPSGAAVQNVYDLDVGKDPALSHVGPLEPWDLHYLHIIDDSGFIDQLYAN